MIPIKIPDVGATVDKVILVRWLVEEGAEIVRGQNIAELETDKAVFTLESVAAGVLLKKYATAGDEVSTGDIIAYVGNLTEAIPEAVNTEANVLGTKSSAQTAPSHEISRPRVTPMLRNFAKQKGVDIDTIVGTGIDGTITRQDIIAAAEQLGSDH